MDVVTTFRCIRTYEYRQPQRVRPMLARAQVYHKQRYRTGTIITQVPNVELQCISKIHICGQHCCRTDPKVHADFFSDSASYVTQQGRRRIGEQQCNDSTDVRLRYTHLTATMNTRNACPGEDRAGTSVWSPRACWSRTYEYHQPQSVRPMLARAQVYHKQQKRTGTILTQVRVPYVSRTAV